MPANGILASVKPAATTETILYSSPAGETASLVVKGANQGAAIDKLRIAAIDGILVGDLTDADYMEYQRSVGPEESFESFRIVLGPEQSVLVRSDLGDVNFVAQGYQETE